MKKLLPIALLTLLLSGCKDLSDTANYSANGVESTEAPALDESEEYCQITEQLSIRLEENQEVPLTGNLILHNGSEESVDLILSDTDEFYLQDDRWEPI